MSFTNQSYKKIQYSIDKYKNVVFFCRILNLPTGFRYFNRPYQGTGILVPGCWTYRKTESFFSSVLQGV